MFQWALNKLEANGRKLVIYDRDGLDPYLTRYYLAYPDGEIRKKTGLREDIPFNTFLHQFMRSDDDVFHTHPWMWYHTVILKGGYWAHTPWGTKWCGPGTVKYQNCKTRKLWQNPDTGSVIGLPANLHWVEIPKPGQTWTLFTRGPSKDKGWWGFWPDQNSSEIIYHEDYLEQQRKKALNDGKHTDNSSTSDHRDLKVAAGMG